MRRQDKDADQELVELAALADGSLAPERAAALETQVAASPELADRLAEQQRALELTLSAAAEVEAPASLRARIEAPRRTRRTGMARSLGLIGVGVAAAAAVAIGISVFGSETSGERLHAALAPTDLVPGADGEATLTKTDSGWEIELDATGLPRLEAGRFYQAWLRNADGVLVAIGTFNEGQDVTLWAGVSPKEFTTLTVTREQADGDQDSSGERVLVGTVDTTG
jgi:anti-sigma-K factor RskA